MSYHARIVINTKSHAEFRQQYYEGMLFQVPSNHSSKWKILFDADPLHVDPLVLYTQAPTQSPHATYRSTAHDS